MKKHEDTARSCIRYTGKLSTYGEDGELVDALGLIVGLLHQVLVDILEVRDCHVFLEVLIEDLRVVHQLNLCLGHSCVIHFLQIVLLYYYYKLLLISSIIFISSSHLACR